MIAELVFATLLAASLAAAGPAPAAGPSKIVVTYSKNVELVGILANLARLGESDQPFFPYAVDSREKFLPYKNLKAVGQTGDLLRRRSRGYLVRTALRFSDLPEARLIQANVSVLFGLALSRSMPALKAFYLKSDFERYWAESRPLYERWKSKLEEQVVALPLPAVLEDYFGQKRDRYTLVFTAQTSRMRTWEDETGDGQNVRVIFGPYEVNPDGGSLVDRRFLATHILLRGIGHLWVTEILDKHPELVEKYSYLKAGLPTGPASPARPLPWKSVLVDNVRAAVVIRLTEKIFGPTVSEEVLRECLQEGAFQAGELARSCGEYEVNRAKYPTFESFLPDLLSRWAGRTKR